ncbi:branched-chain amino acid transport system substrate-binding protein [Comamonas sp. BIGb0152]|uniref:ABC transporter substrate-binding protein n=1 Tax=Comamonas sp. BIGb0152 TaxID=2940601 RepID=UPI00216A8B5E|nr:ABC transporter substrate-binding protein [Comamonas sp. BIGb0152]MCS4294245.1 branched-chain amino acid transport system substrate-binding protein [Comamonas sp. BIGb0152]
MSKLGQWRVLSVAVASLCVMAGASAAGAANAPSGAPIRIGLLAPLTGSGGAYGKEEETAAKAAAAHINAHGGVLGRPLEIVVADDETTPTAGVSAARKLIDVDGVVAITGVWSSAVALAVRPVALEKSVALLPVGSADELTEGDNKGLVWRFQTNGKHWGQAFANVAYKDGAKTASILVLQTPFTLSTVKPFAERFAQQGGKVLDTLYFNPNQPSYRAEVEKIFSKKPDAVFLPSYIPEFSAIVREIYRSGYESKLYTFSHAADSGGKFVQNVGKAAAEGVNHVQATPVGNNASYQLYLKQTQQPEGTIVAFGANVFDEINVLALAIEKAKSAKAVDFSKEIANVVNAKGPDVHDPVQGLQLIRAGKPFRYSGATADFRFASNGDQVDLDYGHYRVLNGVSKLVGTTK